jgi:succinyl-diaminopimelate desuccinylase
MDRDRLIADMRRERRAVVEIAKRLVAIPTDTPPGDTREIAAEIAGILKASAEVAVEEYPTAPHVTNVVARITGREPGPRLVFNGHMDTFPLGERAAWSANPRGEERDGRLYGVGVTDMKGGLAAAIFAMTQLARHRAALRGEVVATFVGDEETMGVHGTQFLLERVPHATGDAMISGDTGSPEVLRVGEKGMIWMTVGASGRSSHAAHVHRGDSAIERLLAFLQELVGLRQWKVNAPDEVLQTIDRAAAVSEPLSGRGESDVLKSVTLTIGTIQGGRLANLVADKAQATIDIRLPVGAVVAEVEAEILRIAARHGQISVDIHRRFEPTWTDPGERLVKVLQGATGQILGSPSVVNMRIGASDARLYRRAGVPSVVCGVTPNNMGAPDEYVEIEELMALGEIFTLAAYDYLQAPS